MRYGSIAYEAIVNAEPRQFLADLEHLVKINLAPGIIEWNSSFPIFRFERHKSAFWYYWMVGGAGGVEKVGEKTRMRFELFVDYPQKQMICVISYMLLVIGCATGMVALAISEPWQIAWLAAVLLVYFLLGFLAWTFRRRCFSRFLRMCPDVASKEIDVINDCLWKYHSRLVESAANAEICSDRQVAT